MSLPDNKQTLVEWTNDITGDPYWKTEGGTRSSSQQTIQLKATFNKKTLNSSGGFYSINVEARAINKIPLLASEYTNDHGSSTFPNTIFINGENKKIPFEQNEAILLRSFYLNQATNLNNTYSNIRYCFLINTTQGISDNIGNYIIKIVKKEDTVIGATSYLSASLSGKINNTDIAFFSLQGKALIYNDVGSLDGAFAPTGGFTFENNTQYNVYLVCNSATSIWSDVHASSINYLFYGNFAYNFSLTSSKKKYFSFLPLGR